MRHCCTGMRPTIRIIYDVYPVTIFMSYLVVGSVPAIFLFKQHFNSNEKKIALAFFFFLNIPNHIINVTILRSETE